MRTHLAPCDARCSSSSHSATGTQSSRASVRHTPVAEATAGDGTDVNSGKFSSDSDGETYVLAARLVYELLALSTIEGDRSVLNGSPVVSKLRLFLRSDRYRRGIGTK
jgi:hypothetical protein